MRLDNVVSTDPVAKVAATSFFVCKEQISPFFEYRLFYKRRDRS